MHLKPLQVLAVIGAFCLFGAGALADHQRSSLDASTLPTGRRLISYGSHTPVGSFPCNMSLSPDGKWIAVTDSGFREYISILNAQTGQLVSRVSFNPARGKSEDSAGLYYGLAWAPSSNSPKDEKLYASCGALDKVAILSVDASGHASDNGKFLINPSALPAFALFARPNFAAGIALNRNGSLLYIANNESSQYTDFKGSLTVLDTASGKTIGKVVTPGFPYAAAALTTGPNADKKVYVTSELDGVVSVIDVHDPAHPVILRNIHTGDHPIALLLNQDQSRLYAANASSDSVSIVDTLNDQIVQNLSLRGKNGLPGMTPTGLALSHDEKRLYITLGDLDAVAVVNLGGEKPYVEGMIPAGWYPTAVIAAGDHLFIANAKGNQTRNPNGDALGPGGSWGRYIQNILEGTVQEAPVPNDQELKKLTQIVSYSDRVRVQSPVPHTTIKHVIYIIKENRTYDQVLGDMPQGNGDPSLCMFGKTITPNLHAMAARFVLLDNFYCSAEVSPDGWNWSTGGMANEYVERNVPYNYSGRGRSYDFEGATNDAPVRRMGLPDVAEPPGGYLWDAAAKAGITYRNYGFFVSFGVSRTPQGKLILGDNRALVPNLTNHTDDSFRQFDLRYADSDAYRIDHCAASTQMLTFGIHKSPDRFQEWKREFDQYVKDGNLPALEMVRMMRDHTSGTRPGIPTPTAMVADNDYSIGQLVDAVSHSPYWKSTLICIVEDDAQNGYDHVDCHRSPAYLISPCIKANSVDHHFYNTDSMLHTIEEILNLKPMCLYDAMAPVIQDFTPLPDNSSVYVSILPVKSVVAQINERTAYGARRSMKMDFARADMAPADELNAIIWRSVKGADAPLPLVRHTLHAAAFFSDAD